MLVSSIDFHAKCLPLLHRLDRVAKSEIRKRQLLSSSIVCQMKNSGLQMQQNQVRRVDTVRVRLSHIVMLAVFSLSVATCLSSGNVAVNTFLILFLSVGACVSDIYAKTWSDQHSLQSAAYQYFLHKSMQIMGWFASSKLAKDSLCADKIQETLLMDLKAEGHRARKIASIEPNSFCQRLQISNRFDKIFILRTLCPKNHKKCKQRYDL